MKWELVKRKVKDLKPYKSNPRTIAEQGLKDLTKSIKKFGLAEPIIINTDDIIIGGHARWLALEQEKIETCDCYIPERKLNDKEVQELNIRLNKNIAGVFDFDILANEFETEDLLDWGFEKWEFGVLNDKINIDEHNVGLPEFYQEGREYYKEIVVKFLTEKDYKLLGKILKRKLTPETKYIWFPEQDFDSNNRDKEYG